MLLLEIMEASPGTVLSSRKGKLLQILGVGFGVAVIVGGTIGIGILRTPGPIAAQLRSPGLIILIWLLGGLYTLLFANYTAELSTMLPKAGGPYVFARRAYGDYGGFIVGWSDWLSNTIPLAFLPIAFAEYLSELVPALAGNVTVVAVSILLLLSALNWIGLRLGSRAQEVMSFLKAVALLAFVISCFVLGGTHTASTELKMDAPAGFALLTACVFSFQLVIGTFGGWNLAIYFAEEDRDPARNIPRSLFGGVLLVIVIYLLVNLAVLYVLPLHELAGSKLAAGDAMHYIFGARGGQIVTVLALISILGALNAVLMFTPRILYALGRDGLFSSKAVYVNAGGTPVVSLGITVLAAIFLIVTGTFEKLFLIYSFFAVAVNVLLICSLFILRKREPNLPRPFKTLGYPFTPLVLLLTAIALFVGFVMSDPKSCIQTLVALAISFPIYLLIKKTR
jgi:basic amino acid/polyamine antiporter, APA family